MSARCASLVVASFFVTGLALADNWPQWRGPTGDSVSTATGLPLEWSETSGIVWKCPLPGPGCSTPAVWGEAIFVTCQKDDDLLLLRISRVSGKVEWTQTVGSAKPERKAPRGRQKFHPLQNMASPSPVTDGRRVFAHFGNGDLAAYDFDGKQLWLRNLQTDYGPYSIWWGHANSPVLFQDLIISVCLQDSLGDLQIETAPSYIVAHDQATGLVRWKTMRDTSAKAEQCDAYTTPIFHRTADGVEMIVMGGSQIDAYDPATGKQRWFLPGIVGGRTITGPTLGGEKVYTTQGMRGPLLAVKLGGRGELSSKDIAWQTKEGTSDSCCPVVWKGLIFWVADNGIAHAADADTGEVRWQQRLQGDYKASPLCADGRVYFLNKAGHCTVVAATGKFEVLAETQLDDETLASPAVADGKLLLRGNQSLYCVGKP
jgi:outer membrane protein assembly factor BamB